MKLKVLITGSTGMVGEGVLQVSLKHPDVEKVVVINRRTCGISHPKLTEIIHGDFFDLKPVADKLTGLDACFFCLGVSSVSISEEKYFATTYTLTINFAETLVKQNPGMTFIYVSGAGTDSTEQGMIRWARVKGKTENDLMKLPFKKVFAFRPGFMLPSKEAKNIPSWSKIMNPVFPVFRTLFPRFACTLEEVGLAMINCASGSYEKSVIEVPDILKLAKR
jgi:uncharacterized protein YbjT (DUF2867 family)